MTLELVFLGCSGFGLALGALVWLSGIRAHRPTDLGTGRVGGLMTLPLFLLAFGAVGFLVSRYYDQAAMLSVPTAIAAGLGGAWISSLVPAPQGSEDEAVSVPSPLIGTVGRLSLPIREGGLGELAYSDGGTTRTSMARSQNGRAIEKGAEVLVTRHDDGVAVVRRIEDVLPGVRQAVRRIESASADQVSRRIRTTI